MGIAITAAPNSAASGMAGTWSYSLNGTDWTAFPVVSASAALLLPSTAQVKFVATHDSSIDSKNSGTVSLAYTAWDASVGTAGAVGDTTSATSTSPYSSAGNTATLNVTPVNNAPTFSSVALDVNEHSTVALTGSFTNDSALAASLTGSLRLYDPDNSTAQILYRVEELPGKGTLTLNGATLAVGSLFAQSNITSIVYTPTVGELTADTTDCVYFTIRDGAGGVIGSDGKNTGSNPWAYLDFNIKDVNAQVAVSGTTITINEDNAHPGVAVVAPISLSISDADDSTNLRTLTVTSVPTATFGSLQYWDGSAYANVTQALIDANDLHLSMTVAGLAAHPLQFVYNNTTEPTDQNGVLDAAQSHTSFTVRAEDNNGYLTETTASATININVTPVNDVPTLSLGTLAVDQDTADNIIGTGVVTVTDPDSPVAGHVYTVRTDPAYGYLTLNGTRIGRGSTFTQAQLDASQLKYTCNDSYYYGSDSLQLYVNDGDGGTSTAANMAITIAQSGTLLLPPVDTYTDSGNTVSVTGTLEAVVPESLFFSITSGILSDSGTGATYTVTAQPTHGKVYLNGTEITYGTTTFTQADINSGTVAYLHDGTEADTYSFHDTIAVRATVGTAILDKTLAITITPVDDIPTITQTVDSYDKNQAGTILMEQNSDGSDGLATADASLSNVTNAKLLTTDNFTAHDNDTNPALTYFVENTIGGSVARWDGSQWNAVTSFSVTDLAAGKIAYP